MNATMIQPKKGDKLTVEGETLELVSIVRRDGTQYVYLADLKAADAIRSGKTTAEIGVLTGIYRVRKLETQYLYRLMSRGLVTVVA